ncbi:MAG: hypothetical protein ORN27_05280 [Rhodoluna sp.]|nr:hypothetical protein [Rhodoluna sp.]
MTVRINPSRIMLWRSPTALQLGIEDPIVLEDVTAEQEHLLSLFDRGVADDAVEPGSNELIERISPALLAQSSVSKPQLSGDFVRGAFAELIRASYATNFDGIAVLEKRAKVGIHIDSLGLGGLLLTLGLAAAGVGRIYTSDDRLVGEHELGPLSYPTGSLNKSRVSAINDLLRARPGSTTVQLYDTLTPAKRRHALRVITGQNALLPSTYRGLVANKVAHVAVLFGTDFVSVSPRILGRPCLGCLDLHRVDGDPTWPVLASQLVGRADYLEDARSALFAAAMAVGEIIRAIDTPESEAEFVGHRLRVASGTVEPWSWPAHPECDCA